VGARAGFEVVRLESGPEGVVLEGSTSAIEDGRAWWVRYRIEADTGWRTRRATLESGSADGVRRRALEAPDPGRWLVDGVHDPRIDDCIDVDLEASACTNTLPVHRLGPFSPAATPSPAVYVRAPGLEVERLDQTYRADPERQGPTGPAAFVLAYDAPRFDYRALLGFDEAGLVLDYPGLARRAS
jgi:hypothetical protein